MSYQFDGLVQASTSNRSGPCGYSSSAMLLETASVAGDIPSQSATAFILAAARDAARNNLPSLCALGDSDNETLQTAYPTLASELRKQQELQQKLAHVKKICFQNCTSLVETEHTMRQLMHIREQLLKELLPLVDAVAMRSCTRESETEVIAQTSATWQEPDAGMSSEEAVAASIGQPQSGLSTRLGHRQRRRLKLRNRRAESEVAEMEPAALMETVPDPVDAATFASLLQQLQLAAAAA